MNPVTEPIEQIRTLCLQTAQAVVAAQKILDEKMAAAIARDELAQTNEPLYSIPRTVLELHFGLDSVNGKHLLIPFLSSRSTTHERHGHLLTFSVVGVPEPPDFPVDGDKVQIQGFQPPFLVSAQVEDHISRQLVKALRDKQWEFALPAQGEPPSQKRVDEEAGKIVEALTPDNPERGMVVLNLDNVTPAYLVIRVTDKSKKDGIFLYETAKTPPVTIYSFDKDGIDNIRYAALHQFVLTIRQWLAGGAKPVPIPNHLTSTPDPSALGLPALTKFAENVFGAYIDTLKFLSELRDDEPVRAGLPSFYDVDNVSGELTYSVFYDENAKRLRFSFGPRMRPDGTPVSDEISVVESKAFVRAFRSNGRPQVETRLLAPEFALTDEARRIVLSALVEAADDIAKAFDDLDRETYLEFIRSPAYQAGAVILLSYEGKVPKPNFLVAWPGTLQHKPRDFVFLCKLKEGKIENITRIMGLAQDLKLDPIGVAEGVEITRDQYEPFHNAFHAVRIWRSRVESS